jgi:hypothetical protein
LLDRAEDIGAEAAVAELLDDGIEWDEIAELIDGIDAPPPVPRGLRERLAASVATRAPPG